MSHIKKYKIFPDKWEKAWSERQLSDARLQLKSYVTSKDIELGIKEVSTFLFFTKPCSFTTEVLLAPKGEKESIRSRARSSTGPSFQM